MERYGYLGFSFHNNFSIRFEEGENSAKDISNFLPKKQYYIIPIIDDSSDIFLKEKDEIEAFIVEKQILNYVLVEIKFSWILIFDKHRVLSGVGDFIKKKLKQHVNLRFGNARIMYASSNED